MGVVRRMKIVINQVFIEKSTNKRYIVSKEFENSIVPNVGDKIWDTLWKDPFEYEVVEKIFDYSSNKCDVFVKPYKYEVSNFTKLYREMIVLHNWNTNECMLDD